MKNAFRCATKGNLIGVPFMERGKLHYVCCRYMPPKLSHSPPTKRKQYQQRNQAEFARVETRPLPGVRSRLKAFDLYFNYFKFKWPHCNVCKKTKGGPKRS